MLRLRVHHTLSVMALLTAACSDSSFSSRFGREPSSLQKQDPQLGTESKSSDTVTKSSGGSENANPFFEKGKSLDLYVVMDKSLSLFGEEVFDKNYKKKYWVQGSDEKCQRFDALLDLIDSLRTKLVNKELVRTTIVSFNTTSSHVGTIDDTLSKSKEEISKQFLEGVCGIESKSVMNGTNYVKGIEKVIEIRKSQVLNKNLDMQSVIFFSDGAANMGTEESLRSSISLLNQTFPTRVWGFILGSTTEKCMLKKAGGEPMTAAECMQMIVDADAQKLVQVDNASELSKGIIKLISK